MQQVWVRLGVVGVLGATRAGLSSLYFLATAQPGMATVLPVGMGTQWWSVPQLPAPLLSRTGHRQGKWVRLPHRARHGTHQGPWGPRGVCDQVRRGAGIPQIGQPMPQEQLPGGQGGQRKARLHLHCRTLGLQMQGDWGGSGQASRAGPLPLSEPRVAGVVLGSCPVCIGRWKLQLGPHCPSTTELHSKLQASEAEVKSKCEELRGLHSRLQEAQAENTQLAERMHSIEALLEAGQAHSTQVSTLSSSGWRAEYGLQGALLVPAAARRGSWGLTRSLSLPGQPSGG